MQEHKTNEFTFRIVNRKPDYSKQEGIRKRETARADLYHIFKKYM